MKIFSSLSILFLFTINSALPAAVVCPADDSGSIHIIAYRAALQPDIKNKSIAGSVEIRFSACKGEDSLSLSTGALVIDSILSENLQAEYSTGSQKLHLTFKRLQALNSITLIYHGSPQSGLTFNTLNALAFTIFSTSQWMPCVDLPSEKSAFQLRLIIPDSLQCAANGVLRGKHPVRCYV